MRQRDWIRWIKELIGLRPNSDWRGLSPGATVVASTGEIVGTVCIVAPTYVGVTMVDNPGRAVFVPLRAVAEETANRLRIRMTIAELSRPEWTKPPMDTGFTGYPPL